LPRPSEITGIKPEVLIRTAVPGAPGKLAIVTRVTYEPGARIRKHYHTGQVVFYILEGTMAVQHEDGSLMTLKAGDSLLIKPGTVLAHWNASSALPLASSTIMNSVNTPQRRRAPQAGRPRAVPALRPGRPRHCRGM